MSKKINIFLFLALTSLLAGSGNCYARTHTIVHEGLDLESPLHKVGPDIKALDKMIFEARKKVKLRNKGDNQEANRALYAIRNIIVEGKRKHNFTSYVFRDNNCRNSLFYIAIGKALDLPVTLGITPSHVLVRYRLGNEEWVNWESTIKRFVNDNFYKKKFDIPEESIRLGVYLRSLSEEEIMGVHYSVIGNEWLNRGELDKAIENYSEGINFLRLSPLLYYNRGITYFRKKSPREAIADFDETIRLNPYYAMAYYFRGRAKTIIGLQQEAKKDYETVLNLKKAILKLKNYL